MLKRLFCECRKKEKFLRIGKNFALCLFIKVKRIEMTAQGISLYSIMGNGYAMVITDRVLSRLINFVHGTRKDI